MENTSELLKKLNQGFEYELPSGLPVRLRRISLEAYKRAGTLPTHLQSIVAAIREQGLQQVFAQQEASVNQFFEWVICEALLEPKVAVDPQDADTLPLDFLPEQDKSEVFQIAFWNVSKALERLRPLLKAKAARGSACSTPSDNGTASGRAS